MINEDSYVEGPEKVTLYLSRPEWCNQREPHTAVLNIIDDGLESPGNVIDDAQSFVYLHYRDFLNREPDAEGLAFWTNQITSCGSDAQCIEARRSDVSASFFLSIEFQETAYLLYLMQKESFATMPKYATFMHDLQEVSRGVIVNSPAGNKNWLTISVSLPTPGSTDPSSRLPTMRCPTTHTSTPFTRMRASFRRQAEKDKLVAVLNSASMNRSAILLEVASDASFRHREQNPAFVLMQYFGYLRRDPNALPDTRLERL
mgnify:CR=1 FL=1